MKISVIICTWNNAKRLAITLQSFTTCSIPDDVTWEVVLVNNNCTDETDQVVGQFKGKLPLVYVREPQQSLSRARNAGLAVATGRLIVMG